MAAFEAFTLSEVELLDPELLRKREDDRAYLLRLTTDNLLRPYRLEAGLWTEPAKPEGIHWGWESPSSQLRGHFLGHWLSAASMLAAATGDREIRGKAEAVIEGLAACQEANGGEWLGSIPEKYLDFAARGRWVWAPHYTLHKTFMGLMDARRYLGSEKALELAENWARWFLRWSAGFSREKMDDILDYETGGMLEIWAELLGITGKAEYRQLLERYTRRRLFEPLLEGKDPLSNTHANTTIPEILGAARVYEVTGEARWLDIVRAYWELAAERLPRWATGGSTTGEVWVPEGRAPYRLGEKNQELCVVYNLMRLAEFLFRQTGEARFADYWERNLRNGVMAQGFWRGGLTNGEVPSSPLTGLVTYFLPLKPGAKKLWASETEHFFCCHGSNVQANSNHSGCVYYKTEKGLAIGLLLESRLRWKAAEGERKIEIRRADLVGNIQKADGSAPRLPAPPDYQAFEISLSCPGGAEFSLSLRLPWWLAGKARVWLNGQSLEADAGPSSFLEIRRSWKEDRIRIELPKRLSAEPLPGAEGVFAFMDGPDLLAGLCAQERTLSCAEPERPEEDLVSDDEREWGRWKQWYRSRGTDPGIRFIPLREVGYEPYTVYFPVKRRQN